MILWVLSSDQENSDDDEDMSQYFKDAATQVYMYIQLYFYPFKLISVQLTIPKKMTAVHLTIMLCHLKSAQITARHCLSC